MAATTTVEVFVLTDACGDTGIGMCEQSARENYEESIGPLADCDGFRIVKVFLTIPLPEIQVIEVTATASDLEPATVEA